MVQTHHEAIGRLVEVPDWSLRMYAMHVLSLAPEVAALHHAAFVRNLDFREERHQTDYESFDGEFWAYGDIGKTRQAALDALQVKAVLGGPPDTTLLETANYSRSAAEEILHSPLGKQRAAMMALGEGDAVLIKAEASFNQGRVLQRDGTRVLVAQNDGGHETWLDLKDAFAGTVVLEEGFRVRRVFVGVDDPRPAVG